MGGIVIHGRTLSWEAKGGFESHLRQQKKGDTLAMGQQQSALTMHKTNVHPAGLIKINLLPLSLNIKQNFCPKKCLRATKISITFNMFD